MSRAWARSRRTVAERKEIIMDWYSEAKMRQQERLQEAEAVRRWRCAVNMQQVKRTGKKYQHFVVWLGGRLVASGKRLQAQYK